MWSSKLKFINLFPVSPVRSIANDPTLYSLNGTADRISDCNTAFTHVANETYSDLPGVGNNGFSAIDATTTGPIVGFHYAINAEFGSV